jgi:hypothetical protein
VCGIEITSFALDVDLSGPYILASAWFAASPQPMEFEVERYLPDVRTEPAGGATSSDGNARIAAAFNTRYRVRARIGSCAEWSGWMDIQVGPPNPCGGCSDPSPSSPPSPQQPPPQSPSSQPPPSQTPPPPDQGCSPDGDRHKNDQGNGHDRENKPGEGRGHDPCRA